MDNQYLLDVLKELKRRYHIERDPHWKQYWRDLAAKQDIGLEVLDEQFRQAKMLGLRNPSFEGDEIGWLDDDFTYDDPDEMDDDNK